MRASLHLSSLDDLSFHWKLPESDLARAKMARLLQEHLENQAIRYFNTGFFKY